MNVRINVEHREAEDGEKFTWYRIWRDGRLVLESVGAYGDNWDWEYEL